MAYDVESLLRRTAAMEEKLMSFGDMFALLSRKGIEREDRTGSPLPLVRQMLRSAQTADIRTPDRNPASLPDRRLPADGESGPDRGNTFPDGQVRGGVGGTEGGYYRQTRALRRLSELMLRT